MYCIVLHCIVAFLQFDRKQATIVRAPVLDCLRTVTVNRSRKKVEERACFYTSSRNMGNF